jgi:hypothetical protein
MSKIIDIADFVRATSPSYNKLTMMPSARGLPYGSHIRRTGHYPPRGTCAYLLVLATANAADTNGLTYLTKHGGARDINDHPSDYRPTLLNFQDHTPNAQSASPSLKKNKIVCIHLFILYYRDLSDDSDSDDGERKNTPNTFCVRVFLITTLL